MRQVLEPCTHCPNSKPAAIRLPSVTLPAQQPGETISVDPQKLPCPVLGGSTQIITMVGAILTNLEYHQSRMLQSPTEFKRLFMSPTTPMVIVLNQSVVKTLNNSVCKASAPLTRNEALNGFKLHRAPIGFGRFAIVTQPIDKRITISKQTGQPIKLVPHIELGVSMGLIPGTDKTQWLLFNSLVVP